MAVKSNFLSVDLAFQNVFQNVVEEALGKINPNWPKTEKAKKQVPRFIVDLKNKDAYVRLNTARVLGKIGDPRAVEPLITALKDEDSYVREEAAEDWAYEHGYQIIPGGGGGPQWGEGR